MLEEYNLILERVTQNYFHLLKLCGVLLVVPISCRKSLAAKTTPGNKLKQPLGLSWPFNQRGLPQLL